RFSRDWSSDVCSSDLGQFLAVPVGAQANPLSSGGVIDLDNDYGGIDLRWRWAGSLAGRTVEFTAGTNADRQRQHRRGYENFVGEIGRAPRREGGGAVG